MDPTPETIWRVKKQNEPKNGRDFFSPQKKVGGTVSLHLFSGFFGAATNRWACLRGVQGVCVVVMMMVVVVVALFLVAQGRKA